MRRRKEAPVFVTCDTCANFERDTSGPSRNAYSGVYFMGVCRLHLDPDNTYNPDTGKAKLFADNLRQCNNYKNR